MLLSGHHGKIARWRRDEAFRRTVRNRPDLIERCDPATLDKKDRSLLAALGWHQGPDGRLGVEPKAWKNSPLLYVHERSPLPQGDRRRSGTGSTRTFLSCSVDDLWHQRGSRHHVPPARLRRRRVAAQRRPRLPPG
ncbi:hypothetical protein Sgou_32620 [Streptomyces gougerotii]|uniref:tRNA methyltransferase TRMD/TRM10-type domain-containing protein n=1 Tax=Streptomyces gougerotii TaxID=53448 RepID=A0ABQ1D7R4_9ACTN|nr:hypothetical protein Sgou_32620 [Streptomyces gougerotii]